MGAGTPRSLAWNRRRFTWQDEQSMLSYVRSHNVIYHVVTRASPYGERFNIIAIMRIVHGKPLIRIAIALDGQLIRHDAMR